MDYKTSIIQEVCIGDMLHDKHLRRSWEKPPKGAVKVNVDVCATVIYTNMEN